MAPPVETELKFQTDEAGLAGLAAAVTLGHFDLINEPSVHDLDTYYDTAAGALASNGYACRVRRRDGRSIATLKGLGSAQGAVHRRVEMEIELSRPLPDPHAWPPGPMRDLVAIVTGGEPLQVVVTLDQIRQPRTVLAAGRPLATLSLDRVMARTGSRTHQWYEVEVELAPDAPEGTLEALLAATQRQTGLRPEPRSKLEQALELPP